MPRGSKVNCFPRGDKFAAEPGERARRSFARAHFCPRAERFCARLVRPGRENKKAASP